MTYTLATGWASAFLHDAQARWTFPGLPQEEAFSRLMHVVEQRRGVALMTGETGVGKTHLLRHVQQAATRGGIVARYVDASGLDGRRLQTKIAGSLGLNPRLGESLSDWHRWELFLEGCRATGSRQLVLIDSLDRAHIAARPFLESWLSACDASGGVLTSLCAARDIEVWRDVRGERIWGELRIELKLWSPADTAQFIQAICQRADLTPCPFELSGLAAIHDQTGGVVSRVMDLCSQCLVVARAGQVTTIDADLVAAVCRELLRHAA